jgi:hypothetical protein
MVKQVEHEANHQSPSSSSMKNSWSFTHILLTSLSWRSSVSIVTMLRAGRLGFDARQGRGSLFSLPPRPCRLWGPPGLLSNGVLWAFSPEAKWTGPKVDNLHPSIADFKNAWSYTSTPQCGHSLAPYLVKHRDIFTLPHMSHFFLFVWIIYCFSWESFILACLHLSCFICKGLYGVVHTD